MVAAIRSYPVRCLFCNGEGTFEIEDALDYERQEVARAMIQIAAKYSTVEKRITAMDIIGPRRTIPLIDARHETMWFLREMMGLTFQRVGYYVMRDHSTVVHGVKAHKERVGA